MGIKKNVKLQIFILLSIIVIYVIALVDAISAFHENQPSSLNKLVEERISNYSVNEEGQTYGHGPYPVGQTKEPDLIQAQGVNGVVGYVKASDLNSPVSSPEEAIKTQELLEAYEYISVPLYESDGKTIIGEFRLNNK